MIAAVVAGTPRLLPPRPQRGPGLHLPHDGRAGGLARRHARRHAAPGHRADRAQAPGGARPRLPAQLHPRRASPRSSSTCAATRRPSEVPDLWYEVRKKVGDIRHTLPQRRGRPRLQRRFRRHLRHHLRLHRRRLHPSRAARLRRGCALAPAAGARRLEDRDPRRPGRADLPRVLDRAPGRRSASTTRP